MKPSEDLGAAANPAKNQHSVSNQVNALIKDFQKFREARARQLSTRVSGRAVVLGLYPVKAEEPCHLVELQLENVDPAFDFEGFTQPVDGKPPATWQSPWMEVVLDASGSKVVADSKKIYDHPEMLRGNLRVAFFMHYLDLRRPLISQFGEIPLPPATMKPKRLKVLKYEQPD